MTPFTHFAFSPPVQALGRILLHSLWQGLVIAALLFLILRLLRQRSANARYLAACMALLMLGACPVVTLFVLSNGPAPQVRPAQTILRDKAARGTVPASFLTSALSAKQPIVTTSLAYKAAGRSPVFWGPVWLLPGLVAAWLLGVVCLSLRLLGNWLHVQWLTRSDMRPVGRPLQEQADRLAHRMGISRPVRVILSARVSMPLVVGWLRATVLFPASALTGLPPRQLEAILAHELAHIRRHDYLVNALQMLLETLLFYHPATWWISEQIRSEREHCCDDVAVQICGDRMVYARALAALEDLRQGPMALAMAADGGHLLARIQRILGKPPSRRHPSALSLGGAVMLCLASLALLVGGTPAIVRASGKRSSDGAAFRRPTLPSIDPVSWGKKENIVRQAETSPSSVLPSKSSSLKRQTLHGTTGKAPILSELPFLGRLFVTHSKPSAKTPVVLKSDTSRVPILSDIPVLGRLFIHKTSISPSSAVSPDSSDSRPVTQKSPPLRDPYQARQPSRPDVSFVSPSSEAFRDATSAASPPPTASVPEERRSDLGSQAVSSEAVSPVRDSAEEEPNKDKGEEPKNTVDLQNKPDTADGPPLAPKALPSPGDGSPSPSLEVMPPAGESAPVQSSMGSSPDAPAVPKTGIAMTPCPATPLPPSPSLPLVAPPVNEEADNLRAREDYFVPDAAFDLLLPEDLAFIEMADDLLATDDSAAPPVLPWQSAIPVDYELAPFGMKTEPDTSSDSDCLAF